MYNYFLPSMRYISGYNIISFFVTFSLDIQQLYGSNNHVHKMEYPVPSTPIYPPIHYRVHFITIGYYDDYLERKNGLVWCRQMYYRRVSGRLKDQHLLCIISGQLWCRNKYLGNRVDVQTLLQRCLQLGGITPYQSQRQHDFLDICLHTKVAQSVGTNKGGRPAITARIIQLLNNQIYRFQSIQD